MKVIIPVAGVGTRLRPLTYTQPKPLIPVAGKPIISFIIDSLVDIGITDFVFVIGHLGEKIKMYLDSRYPNLNKEYVYQEDRIGLGHALWTARTELADANEILIVLGDTIYDTDIKQFILHKGSCVGIKSVKKPKDFGIAEINDEGMVTKVSEKPIIPTSNKALVGLYKISEVQPFLQALDFIIDNNIRTHDEFQLTDALMQMIHEGIPFHPIAVNNWYDCGKKEVLLETNTMLLKKGGVANGTSTPVFDSSIIIEPVAIGENCSIVNSIIGPFVTIGNNSEIHEAVISQSIIGNYAKLEEIVLKDSVVGNDTSIKGFCHSLNIGDNTEIDFSR